MNGSESSLSISSSIFLDCQVNLLGRGGGGFFGSEMHSSCTSSSIFLSYSSQHAGGGIFSWSVTNGFPVSNSLFKLNTGDVHGGAIREIECCASLSLQLTFSFFTSNSSPAAKGADFALYPEISSSPFLHSFSTSSSNRAVSYIMNDKKDYSD